MQRTERTWSHSLARWAVTGLALLALAAPARAESHTATAQGAPAYHPILLGADGRAEARDLNRLAGEVRQDVTGKRAQVVVMVHGFMTPVEQGQEDFTTIAGRLRKEGALQGLETSLVGVHWDSGSASMAKWVPKAVGHRITSLLGFKHAIKNPYLEKLKLARQTGRTGLRSVLFRLQEAVPGVPIHLLAHSMGAEVVVAALAPEASCKRSEKRTDIEQPDRTLQLGMVTLAGADLDYDMFCRERGGVLEQALGRAQVWWITVPQDKHADGMLEVRRGAGRCDAVGNRGLKLCQNCLNRLLSRRGLVLDVGDVPAKHGFVDYLCDRRVDHLTLSMLYLQSPENPAGQRSILAALDGLLSTDPSGIRLAADSNPCLRLYAAWRTGAATEMPALTVVRNVEGAGEASAMELAGMSR
jgi:hypothetical protein